MPEFGVVLEIDVFQRSAKMLALLHGLPDPVREMEVFRPMNIGGNRVSGHRIERDDQSDLQASLRVSAMLSAALAPKECPTNTIELIRPLWQSCSASLARVAAKA